MDAALYEHLSRNHSVITTAEARDLGVSASSLRRFVERKELVRVHRNVYRHAAAAVTYPMRLRAGLLAIGPGGAISHRAAVAVHGARSFRCDLVELTAPYSSLPVRAGTVVHRSRVLSNADITLIDGLAITTPARTLIDTAHVMSPSLVARFAQSWMADRKVSSGELDAALGRAGNHPGARRLRPHLGELIEGVDSTEEAGLGVTLRRGGLPPELHVLVTTSGGHTFELDWAYPAVKLGLEMDGYGVHLRSAAAFDDDRWRRNELEIDGWRILNFTSRQLRRPARVIDQVRRALARGHVVST